MNEAHKNQLSKFRMFLKRTTFLRSPLIALLTMSSNTPDFATRATMFGIASRDQVLPLAQKPNAVLLDVRTEDEIKNTGSLEPKCVGSWAHCSVTPDAAPELQDNAEEIVGSDKDAPILIYCGSGRRACKAKEVLESKGYTNVLNAGGWSDVDYLK